MAISRNRAAHLLENLHRQFPAFGTIKLMNFENQTVLVQQGSMYHHSLHAHRFKIDHERLVYRRKRREI
jgi:hypothetical protein